MSNATFFDGSRTRKGERVSCLHCGVDFVRRVNAQAGKHPQRFCSTICAHASQSTCTVVTCAQCGVEFTRSVRLQGRSRHGVQFCGRECKDKAQSLIGKCPQIRPAHYGASGTGGVRGNTWVAERLSNGCVGCGERTLYLLVIHHIDGDRSNNAQGNIEVVCRNCHAKRHLALKNDEWVFRGDILTPRELLSEL